MKIAAAFVGLLMLSGISYAAYHIVNRAEKNETALVTDSVKTPQKQKAKVAVDDAWQKIEPTKKALLSLRILSCLASWSISPTRCR